MAAVLFVALAVWLSGCRPAGESPWQGYLEGEFVYVAAPVEGRLMELNVQRGQVVTNGQPLFALEREPEAAVLRAAEARRAQARADLADRQKGRRPSEIAALEAEQRRLTANLALARDVDARRRDLATRDPAAVAAESLDQSRSELAAAEAALAKVTADLETARLGAREDQVRAAAETVAAREADVASARWRWEQKRQVAPADARVQDTLFREGERVPAGRPVVSLLPPANLKVRFFVPETELARVQVGDQVRVHRDGADQDDRATIRFVSTRAEYTPPVIYSRTTRAKLVYLVEAFFEPATAAKLTAGQPVDVFPATATP